MTNQEEQLLYKAYLDMFHTTNETENERNICEHKRTTTDKSNYYIVCESCGQCLDTVDIYVPDIDYLHHAKSKRYYIKTNYLKIKMMKINKHISYNESKHIINEFIKYDIMYRQQNKKVKYDFILSQILKEMNKSDLLIHLKKFKSKLEKKRMKDFVNILKNYTL